MHRRRVIRSGSTAPVAMSCPGCCMRGRFSIAGALLALAIAVLIGVPTGLIAGYYGGWFDNVSDWVAGLTMALPGIIVLLAARSVIGPSLWWAMAIFGVLLSPAFYRLVYASVTAVRHELFVDAARVAGLSDLRIIGRHILTVVRAPVIIQSAMILGIAIAIQAGLDFLGLGDLTIPTWGTMLQDGFANIYTNPMLVFWPALIIALVCVALTLLANAMRDLLERTGKRTRRRGKQSAKAADPDKVEVITHEDDRRSLERMGEVLLDVSDLSVGYDQPGGRDQERRARCLAGRSARRGARPDRRVRFRKDPDCLGGARAVARRWPRHWGSIVFEGEELVGRQATRK